MSAKAAFVVDDFSDGTTGSTTIAINDGVSSKNFTRTTTSVSFNTYYGEAESADFSGTSGVITYTHATNRLDFSQATQFTCALTAGTAGQLKLTDSVGGESTFAGSSSGGMLIFDISAMSPRNSISTIEINSSTSGAGGMQIWAPSANTPPASSYIFDDFSVGGDPVLTINDGRRNNSQNRTGTNETVDTMNNQLTFGGSTAASIRYQGTTVDGNNDLDLRNATSVRFSSVSGTTALQARFINRMPSANNLTSSVTPSGGFYTFTIPSMYTNSISEVFIQKASGSDPATTIGSGGAEPHIVCLDGSRLEVYHDGVYRLFEDPETGFQINMGVRNTYISDICAIDKEGVVANITYDVDNDRCLHANFLEVVEKRDGVSLEVSEKADKVVLSIHGYTLTSEARYRSFGLENGEWARGQRKQFGGALAALVHVVSNLHDAAPGVTRDLELGRWVSNALSCDAHFPHIVTFSGAQRIPGRSDDHLLFMQGDTEVRASMDDFSRLNTLTVRQDDSELVRGTWTRPHEALLQDAAPETSLVVVGADGAEKHFATSNGAAAATDYFEHTVKLADGNELLVRMQANGGTSFALSGDVDVDVTEGLLIDAAPGTPPAALSGNASSSSIYERTVEPHLAWKRGETSGRSTGVSNFCAV